MKHSRRKILFIFVVAAVLFAALVFVSTQIYSLKLVRVHGRDMEPTLNKGDLVLTTQRLGGLRRGDIVIFKYPGDPSQNFVKRIVGLPGELVEIRAGAILIDGKILQETYVDPHLNRFPFDLAQTRIPEGSYYVLGDNRDSSSDSRFWGPLSATSIHAKVLLE